MQTWQIRYNTQSIPVQCVPSSNHFEKHVPIHLRSPTGDVPKRENESKSNRSVRAAIITTTTYTTQISTARPHAGDLLERFSQCCKVNRINGIRRTASTFLKYQMFWQQHVCTRGVRLQRSKRAIYRTRVAGTNVRVMFMCGVCLRCTQSRMRSQIPHKQGHINFKQHI